MGLDAKGGGGFLEHKWLLSRQGNERLGASVVCDLRLDQTKIAGSDGCVLLG